MLEGVAFAIRDSVEIARSLGIHVTESGLCGGGAKSPLWRKIMANVLHMEMQVPVMGRGARATAARFWAMVAAGAYPTVREALRRLAGPSGGSTSPTRPSPPGTRRATQVFKTLYPALKSIYPTLANKE